MQVVRVDLVTGRVRLACERGLLELKTYSAGRHQVLGVVVAGGVAGTFDSPSRGLYDKLGTSLSFNRTLMVAAVRLLHRTPGIFFQTFIVRFRVRRCPCFWIRCLNFYSVHR